METDKSHNQNITTHKGNEPHLLREIVRTHQVLMSGFSREVGMPASRFVLMRILANTLPGYVGIIELARILGINAAAVTRQIKEMEREKLILRRSDMKDGRRSYVKLSARGLKLFTAIHDRSHDLERSLLSVITHEEMTFAVDVLTRLRKFIEGLR
jgi:DNA-binding MarR family transcriptional regulator